MTTTVVNTPSEQPISMKEYLTCLICRELFYQPIRMTFCNHSFCGHCMAGVFRHNPKSSCPTCRGEVTGALPDHKTEALLDLFLAANPAFEYSLEDTEAFEDEYKYGDAIAGIPNMIPNDGYMVGPVPGDFTRQELEIELDQAEDYVFDKQISFELALDELEDARRVLDGASQSAKHAYLEWLTCSLLADQRGGILPGLRMAEAEADCNEAERMEADALLRFTTVTERAQISNETLVQAQDAVQRLRSFLKAHVVRERILRLERLRQRQRQRQRRREASITHLNRAVRRSTSIN